MSKRTKIKFNKTARRMCRRLAFSVIMITVVFAGIIIFLIDFADGLWVNLYAFNYEVLMISYGIMALWGLVILFVMYRHALRINEIIQTTYRTLALDDQPIVMSRSLSDIQLDMMAAREQALRTILQSRELEQRKSDLIVYLAHDLKTPLTSVIGYLTLLNDHPELDTALRAEYTGVALSKAERLEELINEFFDITRFSLMDIKLQPRRCNLSRMLEQVAYEFNPALGERGLRWKLNIAPKLEIVCDPDKLERVFENIIRNAVSYSYQDTVVLLSARPVREGVRVCVINRGKTIPPDSLKHLFDQFYRADTARSSSSGGAGLGLSIARRITELHGGTIKAESANETIRFTVILPLDYQKIVRNPAENDKN